MSKTQFPPTVQEQIGARWVLVVKNTMDFALEEPEMETCNEHMQWFHNFWWETNERTRPKLIAFFDSCQQAVEQGQLFAISCPGEWNWAVYSAEGQLEDGCF